MKTVLVCTLVLCALVALIAVDAAAPAASNNKVAKKNNPCQTARIYRKKFGARHTRTKLHVSLARNAAKGFRANAHIKHHRKTYGSSLKHHYRTAKKDWRTGRKFAAKYRRALSACIARIQNVRQSFLTKSRSVLQKKPCLRWQKKCRTRRIAVNTKSKKYQNCTRACALRAKGVKENSRCTRKCGKRRRVKKCVKVPYVSFAAVCPRRRSKKSKKSKKPAKKPTTPKKF